MSNHSSWSGIRVYSFAALMVRLTDPVWKVTQVGKNFIFIPAEYRKNR